MTEEVSQPKTSKKKKTVKKAVTAKSTPPKPKVTVTPTAPTAKPAMENKEVKAENTAKPADPDDIYAKLDWETNPPINGFYEMMMELTRSAGRNFGSWQGSIMKNMKTERLRRFTPEVPREQPRQEENTAGSSRRTCCYRCSTGNGGYFPFSRHRTGKPKEEVADLTPRDLPSHAGDAPARRLAGG